MPDHSYEALYEKWIEQYAVLPRIINGKIVWLKAFYTKLQGRYEMVDFGGGMTSELSWTEIKSTTNPAEYILFGENNA